MKMVHVSLVGDMVAVSDDRALAQKQLTDMLRNVAEEVVNESVTRGDVRQSIRVRTVFVTMNQD